MNTVFFLRQFVILCLINLYFHVSGNAQENDKVTYTIAGPKKIFDMHTGLEGSSFGDPSLISFGKSWGDYTRILLDIDLAEITPSRFAKVAQATLKLNVTEYQNPKRIETKIAPLILPWNEEVTIRNRDEVNQWARRNSYSNIDYSVNEGYAFDMQLDSVGLVEVDITNIVNGWFYEGLPNYGLLIYTGPPVFGKPDLGNWKITFESTHGKEALQPVLEVVMAGKPPERGQHQALESFPSAFLPPVKDPYIFYWGFDQLPASSFAANATHEKAIGKDEAAQKGVLKLNWFYGPNNPYYKTYDRFYQAYVNFARGNNYAMMIDEWQYPKEKAKQGSPLHPDDPFGITASIDGMIKAKQLKPELYITVAWRGETSIERAVEAKAVDMLFIEGYTHLNKKFPRSWEMTIPALKARVDYARKIGMIEKTIPWLGQLENKEDFHPNRVMTTEIIENQIKVMREYAPEMPGVAFYRSQSDTLVTAATSAIEKYFIAPSPKLTINTPKFESTVTNPHVRIAVNAQAKEGREVISFKWFVDNRLMAKTTDNSWIWDTRAETNGTHIITVHAIDDHYNRSAVQIPVKVLLPNIWR